MIDNVHQQAIAWLAVAAQLLKGNPHLFEDQTLTGQECALKEIERLQQKLEPVVP